MKTMANSGPKPMVRTASVTPGSPTRSGYIPDQGCRQYPKNGRCAMDESAATERMEQKHGDMDDAMGDMD